MALAIVMTASFAFAEDIVIGESKELKSDTLDEVRPYKVYTPAHYNDERFPDQKYPVIYLLDGEKYFHAFSGIVSSSAGSNLPHIPEAIVVAIDNTNRSRDLTPSKAKMPFESGGASKFESFIKDELMPSINSEYRTLDYNILVGHSFGGLFALNTLYTNSELFNAYIVIDPSLWWDEGKLLKGYLKDYSQIKNKQRVYFASANSFNLIDKPNPQLIAHYKAKGRFIDVVEKNLDKEFVFESKVYEKDDHGSVVLPAFVHGLRSIFKGFSLNARELLKDQSILKTNYDNFSNALGFEFKPQAFYIDSLATMAKKRNNTKVATVLDKVNQTYYPSNEYLKEKLK
ncbi:MAG: alpha/beta hydrolase-fold protein [Paraglaciecola sp.]|uniref:alpha/beta hydrolase n=1 Tax=Paraglaciecola sp. TaxID=1920173 RepID=UPI003299C4AC